MTSGFFCKETKHWLARAASLPVAFAQVREDPRVELALLEKLGTDLSVVMVASGGCTACALAGSGRVRRIAAVDANQAQLALAQFKWDLLKTESMPRRCELLGHRSLEPGERYRHVSRRADKLGLDIRLFGTPELWSEEGLDFCGRYEQLFAALRAALAEGGMTETVFQAVMSQENLELLFGSAATANRAMEFSRHFYQRTQAEIQVDPLFHGPFLSQMLLGEFTAFRYLWLDLEAVSRLPEVGWHHQEMRTFLARTKSDSTDLVHLSNILDWLEPEQAVETLKQAARVLRPGGLLVLRQLNSTLPVRRLPVEIDWLDALSDRWHREDRSFFYSQLHVGQAP